MSVLVARTPHRCGYASVGTSALAAGELLEEEHRMGALTAGSPCIDLGRYVAMAAYKASVALLIGTIDLGLQAEAGIRTQLWEPQILSRRRGETSSWGPAQPPGSGPQRPWTSIRHAPAAVIAPTLASSC